MKTSKLLLLAVLLAFGPALAGEVEEKIEIKVVKTGDGGDTDIHWVGKGEDFDDLAVGESRTLEDGVVVTRTEDGLNVEVEGEAIEIPPHPPMPHAPPHAMMMHGEHDGIAIISETEIDTTTQETIRSVLASAGHDEDVHFITGQSAVHEVRIVSKVESD